MFFLSVLFAAVAATTPTCQPGQVTNCHYTDGVKVMTSVQDKSGTMYFELERGRLTDLEWYPASR